MQAVSCLERSSEHVKAARVGGVNYFFLRKFLIVAGHQRDRIG